jgi:glutamate-1-semialdehyde 2,1-aminomutase
MDRVRLSDWLDREQQAFRSRHPRSFGSYEEGQRHYLYGTPSHWMRRWAGGFPMYIDHARGAHLRCVDGLDYVDFCLGDTGGMCGHGPQAVTDAIADRLDDGATFMLPTPDANWVGAELARRFTLPYWGFTTSATEANRAAIRLARMLTGRERVLVFNGCYHGSVDEAHVALADGQVTIRNGIHSNAFDHARLSRVIEFNDVAALEAELAGGGVACVLAEPCMTNFGMIEPLPGFLTALREITRRTGTLLVLDETHTISAGPGGYTSRDRLEPDLFVVGKAIGGGIPVGLLGVSEALAERLWQTVPKVNPVKVRQSSHLGFGGTLAGSALQVRAVRAVLSSIFTDENFARMIQRAEALAQGARNTIEYHRLPWHVMQAGARVEIMWSVVAGRNATEVARSRDGELDALLHVYALNRGIVITPFHSMLLMCPATSADDVTRFTSTFAAFCADVAGLA